jgi:hypothetical protein
MTALDEAIEQVLARCGFTQKRAEDLKDVREINYWSGYDDGLRYALTILRELHLKEAAQI